MVARFILVALSFGLSFHEAEETSHIAYDIKHRLEARHEAKDKADDTRPESGAEHE